MKRIFTTFVMAAAAAFLLALPAAAQSSHGQGHPGGAAAGSMGGGHDTDASGNLGSKMSGSPTPSELLMQKTQLASKLSSLLPPGTDLQTAASGFKNLGQFVAAVHVSHNLGIPFAQLKCTELATKAACTTMNGTTTETLPVPSKGSSLGQAIHSLKPTMSSTDSKSAAKRAKKDASADLQETAS
jgi:hypothetical protein